MPRSCQRFMILFSVIGSDTERQEALVVTAGPGRSPCIGSMKSDSFPFVERPDNNLSNGAQRPHSKQLATYARARAFQSTPAGISRFISASESALVNIGLSALNRSFVWYLQKLGVDPPIKATNQSSLVCRRFPAGYAGGHAHRHNVIWYISDDH
jgi:hypothetical protein